jgi:hypothetical protein
VPLFGLEGRRPPRRALPALERTLAELRRADVDEGPTGPTIRAVVRTLAERFDDQADASLYASSTAARTLVDLVRLLAGENVGAASFDELRELLSTPPSDETIGPP